MHRLTGSQFLTNHVMLKEWIDMISVWFRLFGKDHHFCWTSKLGCSKEKKSFSLTPYPAQQWCSGQLPSKQNWIWQYFILLATNVWRESNFSYQKVLINKLLSIRLDWEQALKKKLAAKSWRKLWRREKNPNKESPYEKSLTVTVLVI